MLSRQDLCPHNPARQILLRTDDSLTDEDIELSILARQCLDQRIGSLRRLRMLTAAWLAQRKPSPIRWRFTTKDARIKLRKLYHPLKRGAALEPRPASPGPPPGRRRSQLG